jgi:hypothetical protein
VTWASHQLMLTGWEAEEDGDPGRCKRRQEEADRGRAILAPRDAAAPRKVREPKQSTSFLLHVAKSGLQNCNSPTSPSILFGIGTSFTLHASRKHTVLITDLQRDHSLGQGLEHVNLPEDDQYWTTHYPSVQPSFS